MVRMDEQPGRRSQERLAFVVQPDFEEDNDPAALSYQVDDCLPPIALSALIAMRERIGRALFSLPLLRNYSCSLELKRICRSK